MAFFPSGVLAAALACCGLVLWHEVPPERHRAASRPIHATVACVALGVSLGILGSKLATIGRHAVDLPFWDQRDEAALHVAYRSGMLTWGALFEPHSEHRILLTRVLDLLLASANGQWDNRLQAVVDAGIHTAAVLALLGVATAPLRRIESAMVAVVAVLAAALPFAHENVAWGFQSQFYLDLLFSIVGVALAAGGRPLSASPVSPRCGSSGRRAPRAARAAGERTRDPRGAAASER